MKVLIQQLDSREFIGNEDAWVSSIDSARDFHTTLCALDFCFARHLHDVQIRARFHCGARDIVWGVNDAAG